MVSELGTRIGLTPNSHLFFISGEELTPILETAHVNRALRRHRWFGRSLAGIEDRLSESERGRKFAQHVSLTTITFLSEGDGPRDVELRRRATKGTKSQRKRTLDYVDL